MQQALLRASSILPESNRMLLGIGINVGDVMVKDGNIFGDRVNITARVEALSGGICITRGVRDHLRAALTELRSHGDKERSRALVHRERAEKTDIVVAPQLVLLVDVRPRIGRQVRQFFASRRQGGRRPNASLSSSLFYKDAGEKKGPANRP
jgi:hypothetical protein